jgi:hypothetical protein
MRVLMVLFIALVFLNAYDTKKSNNLKKSGNYVIDKDNSTMWQDTKHNVELLYSHIDAPKYCEKLSLGGYSNWRLPTVEEYQAIIDRSRKDEIMIDKSFLFIKQDDYWTIDRTWRTFGRYGYYIFFKSGTAYYENRTYPKYVRCIRNIK